MPDPNLILEAALTTDPDDPNPDWHPITNRIFYGDGGQEVTVVTGRQTELADLEPSRLAAALRNNDGAHTPRNPDAPVPFLGNWEQGKQVRLRERFDTADLADTFTRTVAAGWGTADTGQVWTLTGFGAPLLAADWTAAGGTGRHLVPAAPGFRVSTVDVGLVDVEVSLTCTVPLAVGGNLEPANIYTRFAGAVFYLFRVEIAPTTQAITVRIMDGAGVELAAAATGLTHAAATPLHVRAESVGVEHRLKVWQGATEPDAWAATVVDGTITTAGAVSVRSGVAAGGTVPMTFTYDDVEAREVFPIFAGYLELPEVRVGTPSLDQPCTISAIDRLGRLNQVSAFEGTLAEHIRRYGHSTAAQLRLWMPLSDPAGPWMAKGSPDITRLDVGGFFDLPVPKEPDQLIIPASTAGPAGDDQAYATWAPAFDAEGDAYLGHAWLTLPIDITVGAADIMAISMWWRPAKADTADNHNQVSPQAFTLYGDSASVAAGTYAFFRFGQDNTADVITDYAYFSDEGFFATSKTLNSGGPQWDCWRLVTIRFNMATKLAELYIGNSAAISGTASGITVSAGGFRFRGLQIGSVMNGSIAHIQIRVGAGVMTHAQHLAQYAHGVHGLEGQTAAERIATVAEYAGVPAAMLDLDEGALTRMQRVSMAGATPAQLMQDAARTGQDLLLTSGDGRIVLVPRQRRYNQLVSMEVPFGWLTHGSMAYKPDPPITQATVTRTGRGSVTAVNEATESRYGPRTKPYNLDTLVDGDAGNLAAWTVRVYDQMRTRIPALRINMRNRSDAERKALLRLRIGDRIELTGMPTGSPDDVPHLVIQGIKHTFGPNARVIEFNTSPVLGETPGQAPYCPIIGTDVIGAATVMAY